MKVLSDMSSDEVLAVNIRCAHPSQVCLFGPLSVLGATMRVDLIKKGFKATQFVSYWAVLLKYSIGNVFR